MTTILIAVTIPADTTLTTLADRISERTDRYLDDVIAWAAPGQTGAGIWADPPYDPTADPGNWQTCLWCAVSPGTRPADGQWPGGPCNGCTGAGIDLGPLPVAPRPPGQRLTDWRSWAPQPGDIVPASRILAATWRWRPGTAPHAYLDPDGWIDLPDQPEGGAVAPAMAERLRQIRTPRGQAVVPVTARERG